MANAYDKEKKQTAIKKFKTHDTDTGSSQVQIALITDGINYLVEHLKAQKRQPFSSWFIKPGWLASSLSCETQN